ncbi:pyridoxal 5'-phosphate synthase-like subunit PDX1.2 isoform X2 [Benincasa hispida]|uniref:pyridoxal 5'-phosphate synthase-like subunit PDX1.2 isoform X2 n=1 Tax=Benincasa hispida TaxID=102211 RepID=UPI0019010A17|nr:pyridoxal 5'-phosphate synthase-like subunit PDX1.2 isoform X2 [Benincasa hispida]
MAEESAITPFAAAGTAVSEVKRRLHSFESELARIRSGVIVEVKDIKHAIIAEETGACCVLLSEPIHRGILRMPDPLLFKEIKKVVSIPVIVKIRVGHFVEAQILDSVGVRHFDESDKASAADDQNFINKHKFKDSYFVCGCRNLGEALRRIKEGAAMVKTQGDMSSSSGNIAETLRNVRSVMGEIRYLHNMNDDEVFAFSKKIAAPYDLVKETKELGRLPAIHYAAGGIVTPADAALMMQLGCDGIFLGSEIFDYPNHRDRLRGMIKAVRNYNNPEVLAEG